MDYYSQRTKKLMVNLEVVLNNLVDLYNEEDAEFSIEPERIAITLHFAMDLMNNFWRIQADQAANETTNPKSHH